MDETPINTGTAYENAHPRTGPEIATEAPRDAHNLLIFRVLNATLNADFIHRSAIAPGFAREED